MDFQCCGCLFLLQSLKVVLTALVRMLQAGSGSVSGDPDPCFASELAVSLSAIPLCPSTIEELG
jgi:hypothetical protein